MSAVGAREAYGRFQAAAVRAIALHGAIDTAVERDHVYVADLHAKRNAASVDAIEAWATLVLMGVDQELEAMLGFFCVEPEDA